MPSSRLCPMGHEAWVAQSADPLLEGGVESAHLEGGDFVDAERGVQRAVEDEAADALGERPA